MNSLRVPDYCHVCLNFAPLDCTYVHVCVNLTWCPREVGAGEPPPASATEWRDYVKFSIIFHHSRSVCQAAVACLAHVGVELLGFSEGKKQTGQQMNTFMT